MNRVNRSIHVIHRLAVSQDSQTSRSLVLPNALSVDLRLEFDLAHAHVPGFRDAISAGEVGNGGGRIGLVASARLGLERRRLGLNGQGMPLLRVQIVVLLLQLLVRIMHLWLLRLLSLFGKRRGPGMSHSTKGTGLVA